MSDRERQPRTSSAVVVAEIVGILALTPLLFGVLAAVLFDGDTVVHGAILGAVVGFVLARLRRDVYHGSGR